MSETMVRLRFLLLAGLTCLGLVAVAGCGGSSSDSGGTAASATVGGGTGGGGEASSGGLAAAEKSVEEHLQPITKFTPPGPPIDAGSMSGKSIWYVPISASIPIFAGEEQGIQEAAKALGMKYDTCDGKFLPSAAAACITQAVNEQAGAVVLSGIDPSTIGPALAAAKSAGVPIVAEGPAGPSDSDLVYFNGGQPEEQALTMNWIIADSGGKANILYGTATGTQVGEEASAAGIEELEKNCPECELEEVGATAAQIPKLQSLVSTALTRVPDADYGFAEYDFYAPGFLSGMRQAGRTDMTFASTNAALSQMQEIASGGLQSADISVDRNYLGWDAVDTALRMALGKPLPTDTELPIRIFDESNIDELTLTEAAGTSGEWWGPAAYKQEFPQLWGVG